MNTCQCFPIIVALETSPNISLSTRASGLHAILHSKHTSLLNARFVPSARASFDYQKTLATGPVKGIFHRYHLNPQLKCVIRASSESGTYGASAPLVYTCQGETAYETGISQGFGQSVRY